MKVILPFFSLIFCFPDVACCQNLRGQWKGEFVDKSITYGNWGGDKCEYVIELESVSKNKIQGYSYTYFTEGGKKYYTICKLEGSFDPVQKFIEVRETERTKTNIPSNIKNCFQVHKLTYYKKGDEEFLRGDWIPAPRQDGDCGHGITSLARRNISKDASFAGNKNSKNINSAQSVTQVQMAPESHPAKPNNKINVVKPNSAKKENNVMVTAAPDKSIPNDNREADLSNREKPESKTSNSFEKRSANVIKTIEVKSRNIKLDIFDNGEIDGDSISLFFNGELIMAHKRLTEKPISLQIKLDENIPFNEIEMYAENLGFIPPNTAVMTITDGSSRYYVRVTSDLKKSGVIQFVQKN